ncbi:MAG: hypothetical protein HQL35_14845, partial [Alphaproteobacteria bacterium]|nr:hypothetical protein [Alphaproteobacteria bacterium]
AAEIRELVAFDPRDPGRWWLRLGGERWGPVWLGQDAVDWARAEGAPLTLYATPLDWLRAGCRGAVLLDAGGDLFADLFDGIARIRVPDVAFAAKVYALLRVKPPGEARAVHPEVAVMDGVAEDAA